MLIVYLILWYLVGFISISYYFVKINEKVFGYKHFYINELIISLILGFGGVIVLIVVIKNILLELDISDTIIWSENDEK